MVRTFTLELEGASPSDVAALNRLIASNQGLRGTTVTAAQPGSEEHLGDIYDVMAGMLGPGGTGTAFAVMLGAWLRSRTKPLRCTVKTPDGKVTLDAPNVDDLDAATRSIAAIFPDNTPRAERP
jgi:hypothetical protein